MRDTVSAELTKRLEERKKFLSKLSQCAEYHAINVAAIVLSGEPKSCEPLYRAWDRALRHYEIQIYEPGKLGGQIEAAQKLYSRIVGKNDLRVVFAEIFANAPTWLLHFTRVYFDANFLEFHLPRKVVELEWRSRGLEDARAWPALPSGRLTDGDPIPSHDPRRIELAICGAMAQLKPIPNFLELLCQAVEQEFFPKRNPFADDVAFVIDLEQKPEEEWSPYEKRRRRRIIDYMEREGRKYREELMAVVPSETASLRHIRRR